MGLEQLSHWLAWNAVALTIAMLLDAILGEPDWLWKRLPHPVVLIGRFIGWQDRRLNLETKPNWRRRQAGIVMLIRLLFVVACLVCVWLVLARFLGDVAWLSANILVATVFLAQRSLHDHVAAVAAPLAAGDMVAARQNLSMIVGRQTGDLDEEGVSRAALESLAENHADGVIAPAFWFLIGGALGIALYKAINTADSMVGYKNERYQMFGWASAKLDDVVNFIPARLSVVFISVGVVGAKLLRYPAKFNPVNWGVVRRDAITHASPNAGWPEAAYATALGIALGGPRLYPGNHVEAPFIHEKGRKDLRAADIHAGLLLFHATCSATVLFVFLIAITMI